MFSAAADAILVNHRQLIANGKWKSFQGVRRGTATYNVVESPNAPPDPAVFQQPSDDNFRCNIGPDFIQYKYELFFDLPMQDYHLKRRNITYKKAIAHTRWKFLYNFAKCVQTNIKFKFINTPYGVFAFNKHQLHSVYLPKTDVTHMAAQYTFEIKYIAPPGKYYNHETHDLVDYNTFIQLHSNNPRDLDLVILNLLGGQAVNTWNEVRWDNIKDTYRYVYVYNKLISAEDKKMRIVYKRNLNQNMGQIHDNVSFKDFCYNLMYLTYMKYVFTMELEINWLKDNNQAYPNNHIELLDRQAYCFTYNVQTGLRENYIKLKDLPDPSLMKSAQFNTFYSLDLNDAAFYNIIQHFRFQKQGHSRPYRWVH